MNDLLRRAWDTLDSFKQAYPENWNEDDEQVLVDLMRADKRTLSDEVTELHGKVEESMRGLHQIVKSNEEALRLFEQRQRKALEELAQIDHEMGLDYWVQVAKEPEQFEQLELFKK